MFICYFFKESLNWPSGPRMSWEDSFERKLKVIVSFLSDWIIGGQLSPLPRSFFPKSSDQNFEIAILFKTVEKFNNYVFEDDLIPHSPGGTTASYKLSLLFTYSISYWEVYRHFQVGFFSGWGGGGGSEGEVYVGGSYHGRSLGECASFFIATASLKTCTRPLTGAIMEVLSNKWNGVDCPKNVEPRWNQKSQAFVVAPWPCRLRTYVPIASP